MYLTEYHLPQGARSTTQCYAEDCEHLRDVMALRGMNERLSMVAPTRYPEPAMASDLMARNKVAEANHALVWTSMIAVKAGVADGWDLLNDGGIVHEVAHLLHTRAQDGAQLADLFTSEPANIRLARRIEAFERLVPGVHPCWGGEDRSLVPERTPPSTLVDALERGRRPPLGLIAAAMEGLRAELVKTMGDAPERGANASASVFVGMDFADSGEGVVATPPKLRPGSRTFAMDAVAAGKAARAQMLKAALRDRSVNTPTLSDMRSIYGFPLVYRGGPVTTSFVDPDA